jgi:predicted O-methyltransferase YrrM
MIQGALEDNFVFQEFKNLVSKFNIKKIIETGTFYGWSTTKLSQLGLPVITIESSVNNYNIANENFSKFDSSNITSILGNSPDVLKDVLTEEDNNVILFLDAHWYDYWPIHDELRVCIEKKIKPVIIIHDFFVPDKNGGAVFGFDKYGDQKLDLDYIKDFLNEIYGEGEYDYYYNSESDNVGQGVIYIYKNDIGTN